MKRFKVTDKQFKTSSFTQPGGIINCVAVAKTSDGFAVRQTTDKTKTTLFFTPSEWDAFQKGVRNDEFD